MGRRSRRGEKASETSDVRLGFLNGRPGVTSEVNRKKEEEERAYEDLMAITIERLIFHRGPFGQVDCLFECEQAN